MFFFFSIKQNEVELIFFFKWLGRFNFYLTHNSKNSFVIVDLLIIMTDFPGNCKN